MLTHSKTGRASRIAIIATLIIVWVGSPSTALSEVKADHGGYGLLTGMVAFGSVVPFASWMSGEITGCDDADECSVGAGGAILVGTTWIGALSLVAVSGWGATKIAKQLEFDPSLGWGIAGGVVGAPAVGLLYLALPKYEPTWLHTTLGLGVMAGGAFAGQALFRHHSSQRSHAYPEFGFGVGGMVLGAGLGAWLGKEDARYLGPLLGGVGGLLGIALPALLWPNDSTTQEATRTMPLQIPFIQGEF